jgi:ADP-heptose:LPS heptosyltransferase
MNLGYDDIGIGGALTLSCVVRELRKVSNIEIDLYSYHPELYINNPYITSNNYFTDGACMNLSSPSMLEQDKDKHYNYYFCKDIGIEPTDIHPELYLTSSELLEVKSLYDLPDRYLVLHAQPSNIHYDHNKTTRWTTTKDWYSDRWEEVVNKVDMPVFQVRTNDEPYIHGCIDTIGTTVRQACCIIAQSQCTMCCSSYSAVVSAATRVRAVVIYGGRDHPVQTGYPTRHIQLYSPIQCSPCYKVDSCELGRVCMDRIMPEHVIDSIYKSLNGVTGIVNI